MISWLRSSCAPVCLNSDQSPSMPRSTHSSVVDDTGPDVSTRIPPHMASPTDARSLLSHIFDHVHSTRTGVSTTLIPRVLAGRLPHRCWLVAGRTRVLTGHTQKTPGRHSGQTMRRQPPHNGTWSSAPVVFLFLRRAPRSTDFSCTPVFP